MAERSFWGDRRSLRSPGQSAIGAESSRSTARLIAAARELAHAGGLLALALVEREVERGERLLMLGADGTATTPAAALGGSRMRRSRSSNWLRHSQRQPGHERRQAGIHER
jgi:hypothetical protein